MLCYPRENDEELDLARSVGAEFTSCQSQADIEAALQRAEEGLEKPRNTDNGLQAFRWEMQGHLVEDVLSQAAARRPGS